MPRRPKHGRERPQRGLDRRVCPPNFAVVALLVGAFMILNTFAITVAQRTRENGLLRALGAMPPRQATGS